MTKQILIKTSEEEIWPCTNTVAIKDKTIGDEGITVDFWIIKVYLFLFLFTMQVRVISHKSELCPH